MTILRPNLKKIINQRRVSVLLIAATAFRMDFLIDQIFKSLITKIKRRIIMPQLKIKFINQLKKKILFLINHLNLKNILWINKILINSMKMIWMRPLLMKYSHLTLDLRKRKAIWMRNSSKFNRQLDTMKKQMIIAFRRKYFLRILLSFNNMPQKKEEY